MVFVHLHKPESVPAAAPIGSQPLAPPCIAPLYSALQGKWVGFRSAAAGDRFLQARKRSPNRLVFFSQNVGTWEQWEVAAGAPDPDACDWSALSLALRHRRLPQFELAVEVVRVGTYTLPPNAALTPRTLLPAADALGGAAALAGDAGADEEPGLERRELKRMSGVLVHVRRSAAGLGCCALPRLCLFWDGMARLSGMPPGVHRRQQGLPLPVRLPAGHGGAGVVALCGSGEGGAAGHRGPPGADGGGCGGAARLGCHAGG